MVRLEIQGAGLTKPFLEQRQGLVDSPGEPIGRAERGGDEWEEERHVGHADHDQPALEDRDGPFWVPPDDMEGPEPPRGQDVAVVVVGGLGDGDASSPWAMPSGKSPSSARHQASQARAYTEGSPAIPQRSRSRSPWSAAMVRRKKSAARG